MCSVQDQAVKRLSSLPRARGISGRRRVGTGPTEESHNLLGLQGKKQLRSEAAAAWPLTVSRVAGVSVVPVCWQWGVCLPGQLFLLR